MFHYEWDSDTHCDCNFWARWKALVACGEGWEGRQEGFQGIGMCIWGRLGASGLAVETLLVNIIRIRIITILSSEKELVKKDRVRMKQNLKCSNGSMLLIIARLVT